MPHIFVCPDCGIELSKSYLANKKITSAMHGKPYNCKAIENKVGINAYQEPKHQQKNKNKAAGIAAAKSHKELKSLVHLLSSSGLLKYRLHTLSLDHQHFHQS